MCYVVIFMLFYAFFVLPILFAQILGQVNMWLAVIVIGLAAAAHQAWSANIFTTENEIEDPLFLCAAFA